MADDVLAGVAPDAEAATSFMDALVRAFTEAGTIGEWSLFTFGSGAGPVAVWCHPRSQAEVIRHLWIEETLLPEQRAKGAARRMDAGG